MWSRTQQYVSLHTVLRLQVLNMKESLPLTPALIPTSTEAMEQSRMAAAQGGIHITAAARAPAHRHPGLTHLLPVYEHVFTCVTILLSTA